MKRVEAACPGCGAPVEFRVSSSLVTVCSHCSSVVARGDRQLEDLGKTAALVETLSPLELGATGRYDGKSFELVGHTQYKHASGAVWDEWYAALSNGKWAWIAEAQGKFYLTYKKKASDSSQLPSWDELSVGKAFNFGENNRLTVAEMGTAQMLAAEGELPVRPELGRPHQYADLSGPEGQFGTLDFGDSPPTVFIGRAVTLKDLGMSTAAIDDDERATRTIAALHVACPQCGGSLDLHAPDRIQRVICPFCRSELDANQGQLRYLQTLERGKVSPLIPIGREGTLRGRPYTVIGFMQRSVTIEEEDYFWTEYLLYQVEDGFRWLVDSDGHWSFVEPVPPGSATIDEVGANYQSRRYRLFQRCPAKVRYVLGEFYWKVSVGETVLVADYVAPPDILSAEITLADKSSAGLQALSADEINVSHGVYVSHEEIEQAFQVEGLPRGWGVAPHQPNPVDSRVYWLAALFTTVLFVLYALIAMARPSGTVDGGLICCAWPALLLVPFGAWLYGRSFENSRWEQSHIE